MCFEPVKINYSVRKWYILTVILRSKNANSLD